jgi:hypothetical protein
MAEDHLTLLNSPGVLASIRRQAWQRLFFRSSESTALEVVTSGFVSIVSDTSSNPFHQIVLDCGSPSLGHMVTWSDRRSPLGRPLLQGAFLRLFWNFV